jgi:nucleoside-diphosphate-sugar epimerase
VPLGVAKVLAAVLAAGWRWRGKAEAPLLSRARIKFLGLNLDFSIDKAKHVLGYQPAYDFQEAMSETMAWFREQDAEA